MKNINNVKIQSNEMVVAMVTANKKVTNKMETAFKKAASKYALRATKEAMIIAEKKKALQIAEEKAVLKFKKAQEAVFSLSDKFLLEQEIEEKELNRIDRKNYKKSTREEEQKKHKEVVDLRKTKAAEIKAQIAAMTAKSEAKALVKAQAKFVDYYRQFIAELSESQPELVDEAKANYSNYVSLLDKHTVNAVIKEIAKESKFTISAVKAKGSLMTARKQIIFKYDPIFVQKIKLVSTVENTEEKITSLYGNVQWEGAVEALSDSTLRRVGAYDNYFEDTFGVITRDKFYMKYINQLMFLILFFKYKVKISF